MKKINIIKTIGILSLLLAGICIAFIAPTIFDYGKDKLNRKDLVSTVATILTCLITSIAMGIEFNKAYKKVKKDNI